MKINSGSNYLSRLLAIKNNSPDSTNMLYIPSKFRRFDIVSLSANYNQFAPKAASKNSGHTGEIPHQKLYLKKGNESQGNIPSQEYLNKKIESLKSALQADSVFMNDKFRYYSSHPLGRELASTMIMADQDLQDQVAKALWDSTASSNQFRSRNPDVYGPVQSIPLDWREYDIPAMLQSGNKYTEDQVFSAFSSVLNRRAQTTGLTETERLLAKSHADTESAVLSNFHEKMQPVMSRIKEEFQSHDLTFDQSKTYEFSLDTSDFTFSVSGGTEEENRLIENVVNRCNIMGHSYDENNLGKIMYNLQYHRRDDGAYNSWSLAGSALNAETKQDEINKHGIGKTSKEFEEKMTLLPMAFSRYLLDQHLKKDYGFGFDDVVYLGGHKFTGKTPEVSEIIEKEGYNFLKEKGFSYIDSLKEYKGTPTFQEPVFSLSNGRFQVAYDSK